MTIKYYDRDGRELPENWWEDNKTGKYRWSTGQRVAYTATTNYRVSTVWLMGVDHSFGAGPPLLFETMILGDNPWRHQLARYSTEEQAIRGHLDVIDRLRHGKPPFPHLNDENGNPSPCLTNSS